MAGAGRSKLERGLLGAVGLLMAMFGGVMFGVAVTELASGGDPETSTDVYVFMIVVFGGMLVAGAYLAWKMLRFRPVALGASRPGMLGPSTDGADAGLSPQRRSGGYVSAGAPAADNAERERRVLRLAEREHGRLTVQEVAAGCAMTVAEAKTELDRLVIAEIAEMRVTEGGVLVYRFPGFLSDEEKARATDF